MGVFKEMLPADNQPPNKFPHSFTSCPFLIVKRFLDNTISRFTWPNTVCLALNTGYFSQQYGLLSCNSKNGIRMIHLNREEIAEFTKDAENVASNNPKCVVKKFYGAPDRYVFVPSSCQEIRDLLKKYMIHED